MTKTYSEKLRDPRWQKKRLKILERDDFTCLNCGEDKKPLNVHHTKYEFGKEIWDYENNTLITVCEECHKYLGDLKKDIKSIIDTHFKIGFVLEYLHNILVDLSCFKAQELIEASELINEMYKKNKKLKKTRDA